MQSPPTLQNVSKSITSNHIANGRNKYQHSLSAAASPITVSNIQVNQLVNNLNITNDTTNIKCTRSASASPNITSLNMPNYFNRLPNNHYLQQVGRNRLNLCASPSIDCNMMHDTLDLMNCIENGTNNTTAINRRLRNRAYGNFKNGMVRHETKL